MALSMSRPWKHPRTGVYWLRKRVPDDLRPVVAKREILQSLRTKNPAEAKLRHAEALVELETQWKNLRAGPRSLTEREALEFVEPVHNWWYGQHRDNPSEQRFWRTELFEKLWASPPIGTVLVLDGSDAQSVYQHKMERWCAEQADACLNSKGLIVDAAGHQRLCKAVAVAIQQASLRLSASASGQYAGWATTPSAPVAQVGRALPPPGQQTPVTFDTLVTGWSREKKPSPKTLYSWQLVISQLAKFLGHDDATKTTPDDMVAWKNALITRLSPKTIRDAKIAPVRAIFQWGVNNRLLAENPAQKIVLDVKGRAGQAKRSFNDEEAALILKAALEEDDALRRWVPWLCAYSGARVAEVCQLRVEDVFQSEGIWCLKLDPQAGSLKNAGSERTIPLHPAILDTGFLVFVNRTKSGPLFKDVAPDRFGSRGGNGTKVLSRWVRSLGLTDTRLSPNHSWRHRLKTLARRYGLAPDIVNALTGHNPENVGDRYGEYPVTALDRELRKIPSLQLQA